MVLKFSIFLSLWFSFELFVHKIVMWLCARLMWDREKTRETKRKTRQVGWCCVVMGRSRT